MSTTNSSPFLPADFDPAQPLAIIAGKGRYPVLLAEKARAAGVPLRLVAFHGETSVDFYDSFPEADRSMIKVGQVGHMLKALKRHGARYAVMAGQITPRRLFKGLHPDLKAVAILASLKERNAESIFGALAAEIGKIGVCQLDARAFLEDQLADEGVMTGGRDRIDPQTLAHGIRIAKEVARLDIGQGVVVSRGTVLAVEGFEGTDQMLARAGTFEARDPLFVKTVKPAQDYRFDVPVFGLKTLESLASANIRHAAVEADNTIILDKPAVLEEARRLKIQLTGYRA
ncbi:UDP-2,3-diacylglucosamine diphosphatase LpxI [Ruficoccus amylovorans]|uniref:UDP-2,3-diacylglucosamine diphosphatase LpxI n=1 Tax=Ruficoccus amylovorans TaxID=1804625 RepID=A0A842HDD4_9BACT|nr:UDP-2,3-diacylglucosamine diphosphatase LpxI [Ruficoccus amylovorans]MBC2593554.1 UDP-2,3-diacylglucosamine diphosphatase LpxI [Ruficoccus amylovorans]